MIAPRWIQEAYGAACEPLSMGDSPGVERVAEEMLKRLPVSAIREAIPGALDDIRDGMRDDVVRDIVTVLTDGGENATTHSRKIPGPDARRSPAWIRAAIEDVLAPPVVAAYGDEIAKALLLRLPIEEMARAIVVVGADGPAVIARVVAVLAGSETPDRKPTRVFDPDLRRRPQRACCSTTPTVERKEWDADASARGESSDYIEGWNDAVDAFERRATAQDQQIAELRLRLAEVGTGLDRLIGGMEPTR